MSSIWQGERVRLRGVEPEDWEAFMRLDQDSDLARSGWMVHPPRSAEGYRRWTAEQATTPFQGDHSLIGTRYRWTTPEMEARVVAAIEQRLAIALKFADESQ